jgi:hypothetical protein
MLRRMREALLTYFEGEKLAGLLAAAVGLVSLAAAAVFFQPRWDLRPFAVVLGVVGLVELAVGLGLWVRTGPQVERLLAQLVTDANRFYTEEGARMVKVQKNFITLERVWIGLLGVSTFVALTQKSRPVPFGVALGLMLHAAFFLAFDLVAERRGAEYLVSIEGFGHGD